MPVHFSIKESPLLGQPASFSKKRNYEFHEVLGKGTFGKVVVRLTSYLIAPSLFLTDANAVTFGSYDHPPQHRRHTSSALLGMSQRTKLLSQIMAHRRTETLQTAPHPPAPLLLLPLLPLPLLLFLHHYPLTLTRVANQV